MASVSAPAPPAASRNGAGFRRRRGVSGRPQSKESPGVDASGKADLSASQQQVKFPERIKGQAGISAVLNQHMTHFHTDHAVCPLSEHLRSERKKRFVPLGCFLFYFALLLRVPATSTHQPFHVLVLLLLFVAGLSSTLSHSLSHLNHTLSTYSLTHTLISLCLTHPHTLSWGLLGKLSF